MLQSIYHMPVVEQQAQTSERALCYAMLHEIAETIDEVDKALASEESESQNSWRLWQHRALLLERQANILERIGELDIVLGSETN